MKRALLAWELGAGFGHIAHLRVLAGHLRDHGIESCIAVRHLESTESFIDAALGPLLQAPLYLPQARRRRRQESLSYADLLWNCGFDDSAALTARVRAWRALIRQFDCDAVIAEHAPTALLAAKSLGIRAGNVGTGFTVPPPTHPFPDFRPDIEVATDALRAREAAVLKVVNATLERLDVAPLPTLQDLFADTTPGVMSYAEMDHYENRPGARYYGVPDLSRGLEVSWGSRREPRVFAYLRPFPGLESLLATLRGSSVQVLARIGDVDIDGLRSFERPGFVIVDRNIHLRHAAETCDAFINYGAHGTVTEMLLAGKPGLLMPTTREQMLVARRAGALGATLGLPATRETAHAEAIDRILREAPLREAAQRFSARHAEQPRNEIAARWCSDFLGD